jgi:acyl-[acyl-carrier-protein]-phospholipid O-acyltransferase/long-chain-fatty-acid--[acyl-carrier-protein] ligase
LILMTTFLAIIFGAASAGFFSDLAAKGSGSLDAAARKMWLASAVCIGIAVVGTCTSLLVRRVPPAMPGLPFRWAALTVPYETRRMLRQDRPLLGALLASSVFWLVAGVANLAVNSLGKMQLELSDLKTSLMVASIGVGIAIGAVLAGRISRGHANFGVMRMGGGGLIVCLLLLALPGPFQGHLLGFRGSVAALIGLGMFAGMYAIPLQVFMQSRPPRDLKGRMIAAMNQANFIAILLSAVVYWAFDRLVVWQDWPRAVIFALTALLMVPTVVWYHPQQP